MTLSGNSLSCFPEPSKASVRGELKKLVFKLNTYEANHVAQCCILFVSLLLWLRDNWVPSYVGLECSGADISGDTLPIYSANIRTMRLGTVYLSSLSIF